MAKAMKGVSKVGDGEKGITDCSVSMFIVVSSLLPLPLSSLSTSHLPPSSTSISLLSSLPVSLLSPLSFKAMARMNSQLKLPELQKIMMDFERVVHSMVRRGMGRRKKEKWWVF